MQDVTYVMKKANAPERVCTTTKIGWMKGLVSGLFADPKLRWFNSNSELLVHHVDITRADGILPG